MINEKHSTMALTSRGLSVSEVTKTRLKNSSLACWCLKAQKERMLLLLSMLTLPIEVATLGGRGGWAGVRGGITVGPEVPLTLRERRGSEGDGEGTVAGSAVDADMSTAEAGTAVGG